MAMAQEDQVFAHYNKDDEWFQKKGEGVVRDRESAGMPIEKEAIEYGRDIIGGIARYITAGPVVMMVVEGHKATAVVTKLVGGTEPAEAEVGTIRGDYTIDSYALSAADDRAVRNLVHCSEEIIQEKIMYDVNLDGIME